jgi:hypothetical protein
MPAAPARTRRRPCGGGSEGSSVAAAAIGEPRLFLVESEGVAKRSPPMPLQRREAHEAMLCRPRLDELTGDTGCRGSAVLVRRVSGGSTFDPRMRAMASSAESAITAIAGGAMGGAVQHLTLQERVRIEHCPGCGQRLADLVLTAGSELADLAGEDERFRGPSASSGPPAPSEPAL